MASTSALLSVRTAVAAWKVTSSRPAGARRRRALKAAVPFADCSWVWEETRGECASTSTLFWLVAVPAYEGREGVGLMVLREPLDRQGVGQRVP